MQQNNRNSSRDTYRTGRTNPPKSHQGIIALLLILVTVLCSIVTVLGMMNIRLHLLLQDSWQQPEGTNQTELALAEADGQLAFSAESAPILGLTCQAIDSLYRSYNGGNTCAYHRNHNSGNSCAYYSSDRRSDRSAYNCYRAYRDS